MTGRKQPGGLSRLNAAARAAEEQPNGKLVVLEEEKRRADVRRLLSGLLLTDKGAIRKVLANAVAILDQHPECAGVLAYDQFNDSMSVRRPPPWLVVPHPPGAVWKPKAWSDLDASQAALWLQQMTGGVAFEAELCDSAAKLVAMRHAYHPVRRYLDGLKWDGIERISAWLTDHFGAPDTPYTQSVGRAWLISAVARMYDPGCKVDHMIILEGSQGIGKSSALAALCPDLAWFTDQVDAIGSKDSGLQLQGRWIVEIAELDAMSKVESDTMKAWLVRQVDKFRPPYGRNVIEYQRQSVFAGTANRKDYFRDRTGNRRYWPVSCEFANPLAIAAIRDQLWAEAVVAYRAGEPWHIIDRDVLAEARTQQASRLEEDPWENRLEEYISRRSSVTVSECLEMLGVPAERQGQRELQRVAKILVSYSWQRVRRTTATGSRLWCYEPPRAPLDPDHPNFYEQLGVDPSQARDDFE
jgi:predicted P-loop ATPase